MKQNCVRHRAKHRSGYPIFALGPMEGTGYLHGMTWEELRDFLERENERYSAAEQARIESTIQSSEPAVARHARRLAGEFAARHSIDEACRHFATKGKWPQMDAEATLYAHDRWIWAIWFSRWLSETGPMQEDHEQWEWLIWLFIESWDELGSWRWRASQRTESF